MCNGVQMTLPRPIFVDVDDTLVRSFGSKRVQMDHVVRMVRELSTTNAVLYCWSSGGADYAHEVAIELGIQDCFVGFLPKPHVLIDDVTIDAWRLRQVHPNELRGLSADELLK